MSIRDQQEYIISSLPGVGLGLAKPLLKYFKSVKNVVNASEKELEKVEKIGKKSAEKMITQQLDWCFAQKKMMQWLNIY